MTPAEQKRKLREAAVEAEKKYPILYHFKPRLVKMLNDVDTSWELFWELKTSVPKAVDFASLRVFESGISGEWGCLSLCRISNEYCPYYGRTPKVAIQKALRAMATEAMVAFRKSSNLILRIDQFVPELAATTKAIYADKLVHPLYC